MIKSVKGGNKNFLWLLACLLFRTTPVGAVDVKLGGLIFAHYEYVASQHLQNGTTSQGLSSFDVSRIYLNAEAKYDEKISGFINIEDDLTSRGNQNNRVFLKHAELRYAFSEAAKVSFGLIGVPWRSYEEGVWKHRFASREMEDEEGVLFSTDRGLRVSGKIPHVLYDLMVSNGEGTGADGSTGNENTSYGSGGRLKSYIGKLAVAPFETCGDSWKGLRINFFGEKGSRNETQLRNRILGGVSYESARFNAMATYVNSDNSSSAAPSRGEGFSVHAFVSPKENWTGFARFDRWNPNINAGGFSHNRYVYGVGYQIVKGVRVSVDHQYVQQETRTPALADQSLVSVHTELKF